METAGIGIDIGGTATKGAVVSRSGEMLLRAEIPTDPQAGTKGILACVETLIDDAASRGIQVVAIGVGAAGFIDAERGAVTFSPNLVYDDPDIAQALTSRTSLPAFVDNDVNAAAWGEFRLGETEGATHLAFISIGTGLGSGFVIDGRLLRGSRGAGAELGHTVIDPDGPHCPCGLRGCLEQFASGVGIARFATDSVAENQTSSIVSFAGDGPITAEHVAMAAREYDETARAVLRRAGTALGIGLANVVNLFDPQVIVLGGSLVRSGEPYLGPLRDQLGRMLADQRRRPVRLHVTSLGKDVGILGAALLGLDHQEAA